MIMSQIHSSSHDEDENSCCESDEEFSSRNAQLFKNSNMRINAGGGGAGGADDVGGGRQHQYHQHQQQQHQQQHDRKKYKKSKEFCASTSTSTNIVVETMAAVSDGDRDREYGGSDMPPDISPMSAYNEERMRRKLQFFFMNPIEKWQTKRRFPYKFVIQVIKIVFVTLQLCLFAYSRYNHVNYKWDNRITFSHLFLKGWDSTMEVVSYPPATGPLALYEKSEFFETIDYAVKGYANLSRSIGSYSYPTNDNQMPPLKFCLYRYTEGSIYGFNESYIFNPDIERQCISLTENLTDIGSEMFLKQNNITINFSALVKCTIKFIIKTINFKSDGPLSAPDCYKFDIVILFDNSDHDGQMKLTLDADAQRLHCRGDIEYITDTEFDAALRSILNITVMLICIASFSLCARAIYRAQLLRRQTVDFFRVTYKNDLSFEGKMEFVNFWYIMILCNDILLMIGSALKEQIERKFFIIDGWDLCSIFIGIGNLLVWFGVLRYLGFFKTYNVVILTLRRAAPKIMRFLICALLIYAGFTFCGWLILGPYHMKFRSLSTTSECLFSLINGDDMFATFTTMSSKSSMLWWFSRIYLYTFICLYIYVVLSLFISVIMDAYDTIKRYYREGFPKSDLQQFIAAGRYNDFDSAAFQSDLIDEQNEWSILDALRSVLCSCVKKNDIPGPTGYTSLENGK